MVIRGKFIGTLTEPLMATLSDEARDPKTPDIPVMSFASVVAGGARFVDGGLAKVDIQRKRPVERNGETFISFSTEEIKKSVEPLKWTLIGRFGNLRPNVDDIRRVLNSSWNLKAQVNIGILESQHIMIRCANEQDFMKIWTKENPMIKGVGCNFFPWRMDFDPSQEANFFPVWVKLPYLPVNLFNEDFLASIASGIGRFITMDNATKSLARPEWARICVEMDMRKPVKKEINIEMGNFKRKQMIFYENLPFPFKNLVQNSPLKKTEVLSSMNINPVHEISNPFVDVIENKRNKKESTKDWVSRVFLAKKRITKSWRKKLVQKKCDDREKEEKRQEIRGSKSSEENEKIHVSNNFDCLKNKDDEIIDVEIEIRDDGSFDLIKET